MNKKIKNATPFEYAGINFKSKTEVMAYKTFLEHGFENASVDDLPNARQALYNYQRSSIVCKKSL